MQALVNEDAHRSDGLQYCELAGFDDGDDLLTLHRREGIEEILDGLAPFEVINKVLERNTRTDKDRCAAHDLRVGVNDAFEFFQLHKPEYSRWTLFYEARNASVARRTPTSAVSSVMAFSKSASFNNPSRSTGK